MASDNLKILVFQTEVDNAKQPLSNRGHLPNRNTYLKKRKIKKARNNPKILQSNEDIIYDKQKLKFHKWIIFFYQSHNLEKTCKSTKCEKDDN